MTSKETLAYALDRLKEGNSWAGIAAGITGALALPVPYNYIVGASSIAAVVLPEGKKDV